MRNLFLLVIVGLAHVAWSMTARFPPASAAILSTAASSRRAGSKAVKLCVLFGFPSGVGDELQLVGEDVISLSCTTLHELFQSNGFDVAVGYVKASDALRDATEIKLLQNLVALLEGSTVGAATKPKTSNRRIVFYVDGLDSQTSDPSKMGKITRQLCELVREAERLVFPNLGENEKLQVSVETNFDTITSLLNSSGALRTGDEIAAGIDAAIVKSQSKGGASVQPPSSATLESNAAAACSGITQGFIENISTALRNLEGAAAVDEISAVVNTALNNFNTENQDLINAYAGTEAFRGVVYHARTLLVRTLEGKFQRLLDSIIADSLASFEGMAKKIQPNSRLTNSLKDKAKLVIENAIAACNRLQRDFVAIVSQSGDGFFQDKKVAAKFNKRETNFAFGNALMQLQTELKERCIDRERTLFLQGSYNPYIRDVPWAPTHININYLVDPRAVALGMEYNKLYDEHVDGPANRADSLWIQGVTKVAFDPNDHPIPKENKSWLQVLKEFYNSP